MGSYLNSEILDSFASAYLKLVRFPARSLLPIAALPSMSLFPKAPFDFSVCPSMSRVPSAPLMRSDPASLICYPHRLDRPTRSFPRLGSRAKHLTFAKTGCPFCARYARPIPPNTLRREIARQRLTPWPLLCFPAVFATKISLCFSPAPTHQLD